MFTLRTFLIIFIYAVVLYGGYRLETQLAARNSNRPGLILPVVAWLVAIGLSINNFLIAFDVRFGLLAFMAAVMLFVFYSVPALFFSLLYVDGRKDVQMRKVTRSQRVRQAHAQHRAAPSLQRRYEENMKKEPVVYMPSRTNTASASRARRSQATKYNSKKR